MILDTAAASPLERAIAQVEADVAALGAALRDRDASALESATQTLQRTLAASIQRLAGVSRAAGGMPLPLRRRIALLAGQIGAQREQLARASAALERALNVLRPDTDPAVAYGESARPARVSSASALRA